MKKLIFILNLLFLFIVHFSNSQWLITPTNTNTSVFFECSFINADTGWAAGASCEVYFTNNGGNNWTKIYEDINDRIESLFFINSQTGWAGTYFGKVLKTTNGGYNWNGTQQINNRVFDLCFISPNTGWLVGGGGFYKKTTDGGNLWLAVGAISPSDLFSIKFINNTTGFACGNNRLSKTTDGGILWSSISLPDITASSISFIDNQTGWVICRRIINISSSSAVYVLKTTNTGNIWITMCSDTALYGNHTFIYDAKFVSAEIGYFCGQSVFAPPPSSSYGILRKTTNGGINWINVNLGVSVNSFEDISFPNSQTGYLVGYQGKIFKTTNGGPVAVSNINYKIPERFSLYQNYPNPFNPSTKIKFSLPSERSPLDNPSKRRAMDVKLVIYDILGREITTLVNQQLQPGTYEVEWDGSNYPSGVYFYKLTTADFTETKRMVLIK